MPYAPKPIPDRERLIFALDVADPAAARQMVERLGDAVTFYKLGLELFMSGGYYELLEWMVARGKKIFVDLKFFDVPATVASVPSDTSAPAASMNDWVLMPSGPMKVISGATDLRSLSS